jgi:hypothetical protein
MVQKKIGKKGKKKKKGGKYSGRKRKENNVRCKVEEKLCKEMLWIKMIKGEKRKGSNKENKCVMNKK